MDDTGAVTNAWTGGATGLIGRGTSQYLYDPQGSAIETLDASSGSVLSIQAYSAWGKPQKALTSDPIGFGGQFGYYTDAETGLVLCGQRYYAPNVCGMMVFKFARYRSGQTGRSMLFVYDTEAGGAFVFKEIQLRKLR